MSKLKRFRRMKTRNLVVALLTVLAIVPLSMLLADDVPAPYTFARYQAMMDRSPFAVATAVATAKGERSIMAW